MNPLLQRAKDEYAQSIKDSFRNSVYKNWNEMETALTSKKLDKWIISRMHEVAELYSKYRVEEETEKMRKALEAIKNPIKHLQDLAEIEGNKINGSTAIALANSPDFYRNIAEKALNP